LMHSLGHHVLKPYRISWECDLLRCWQRILLKNTTFSLTIWCQTKLFIMLHVGLELSFVWIFSVLGDWLNILWIDFKMTILHRFSHCWLFCVPMGVPKVSWRENRTLPPRAIHVTPRSVARCASQSDLLIDNGNY
jgi:hypothetical protein